MPNSVLEQFTRWPYPEPETLKAGLFSGLRRDYDISAEFPIIWPDRLFNPHLDILVAGCGTIEAAVVAYDNPGARVIGIDISNESLEHSRQLKSRHSLANLTLHCMDLADADRLDARFDLVISSGVLHHLQRPESAMSVLGRSLKPDGALIASMYRRHPRVGVYMIQDAVKRLELGFETGDVALVREILGNLPDGHQLFANTPRNVILSGRDTDVVDTFLNRHDTAYSVPEVTAVIEASGLGLQCWLDNLDYYPDAYVTPGSPLATRLALLPFSQQWAIVELLYQVPGRHRFVLRRSPGECKSVEAIFTTDGFWNLKPALRAGCRLFFEQRRSPVLQREWHRLPLNEAALAFVQELDGHSTIGELVGGSPHREAHTELVQRLWRLGHVVFSMEPPSG